MISRPFDFRRGFRQADRRDLRMRIGAARDIPHVQRMHIVLARDLLDADDALMACLMREPGRARHIADGVDAGCGRAAKFVDDDVRFLDFHALLFQAQSFDIAHDADGKDDAAELLDLLLAVLQRDGGVDAVRALLKLFDLRAGMDLDALLLEGLSGEGRNLLILHGQDAVHDLDHGHLHAERVVEARELDADGAGAHDQQRLRRLSAGTIASL